jgi:hypothetical protein
MPVANARSTTARIFGRRRPLYVRVCICFITVISEYALGFAYFHGRRAPAPPKARPCLSRPRQQQNVPNPRSAFPRTFVVVAVAWFRITGEGGHLPTW